MSISLALAGIYASRAKFSLHYLRALCGSVRGCIFSSNGAFAPESSDGSASHPYLGIDWRRECHGSNNPATHEISFAKDMTREERTCMDSR